MGMKKPNDWRRKTININMKAQPLTPDALRCLRAVLEKAERGEYTSFIFASTLTEDPDNDFIDVYFGNVGIKEVSMLATETILAVDEKLKEEDQ